MEANRLRTFQALDDGDVRTSGLGPRDDCGAVRMTLERVRQCANGHSRTGRVEARGLDEGVEIPCAVGVGTEVYRDGLHIHQVPENTHKNTLFERRRRRGVRPAAETPREYPILNRSQAFVFRY